jgi:MFS family permease
MESRVAVVNRSDDRGAKPTEAEIGEVPDGTVQASTGAEIGEAPEGAEQAPEGTERVAGRIQGSLLLAGSCLQILGALLIAPVLPRIQDHFEGTAGVDILTPVALTIPMLAIGILAPFAGRIIDRVGRLPLLLGAFPFYTLAGTAPLWLDALPAIVVSRALLGVTEAAIMTACITLLGDYFSGVKRDRYLSLQAMVAAFSAVLFLVVGGALGSVSWRAPFWVYFIGLVFLPLSWRLLWPPAAPKPADGDEGKARLAGIPWRRLTPLLVLTLVGSVVFSTLQIELSFVLDDVDTGTALIGLAAGVVNLALALAAASFAKLSAGRAGRFLVAGFLLGGGGLILVALGNSFATITAAAVLAGIGGGFLLPSLLIGTTSQLEYGQRGRGSGMWTGLFALGQFASPIIVNGVKEGTGSLDTALTGVGVAGVVIGFIAIVVVRRWPVTTNATEELVAAEGGLTAAEGAARA